jgi:hypothetical protein
MTTTATAVAANAWVGVLQKIFTEVILIKVKRRSLHYWAS